MSLSIAPIKSAGAGMLAAVGASLCCITPVLSLIAGAGGLATAFTWVEPLRPFLIALTLGTLGFAWFQQLKFGKTDQSCDCEQDQKPSFWRSSKFLGLVTVFAALMLAFPSYAHIFYQTPHQQNATIMTAQDTTKQVSINVKGMTCSGCEAHIENAVGKLPGIRSVDASYAQGTTTVAYLPSKIKHAQIVAAINATGYKIVEETTSEVIIKDPSNISFYKVPLVCNAAPTIGCGSRSKPVLLDLEKDQDVQEAWLNRPGTVIAVIWNPASNLNTRKNVITRVFGNHQVNASELIMNDYAENLQSFSTKTGWYKGSDVNSLSKEEAGIIADRLLQAVREKTKLSTEQEKKLKVKITEAFYDFFLNFKSMDQLGDQATHKEILTDIIQYGNELLGKDKMPDLDALWTVCSGSTKSCSHEGCSSSCKVK